MGVIHFHSQYYGSINLIRMDVFDTIFHLFFDKKGGGKNKAVRKFAENLFL